MSYDEIEAAAQPQMQSLWRSVDSKGGAFGATTSSGPSWVRAMGEGAGTFGGVPFWAYGPMAQANEKERTAPFKGMYDANKGKGAGAKGGKKAPAGAALRPASPVKKKAAPGRQAGTNATGGPVAKNALEAAHNATTTKGGKDAKLAAQNAGLAGLGKSAATGSKLDQVAPALNAAAQGQRPADQLLKLDQPAVVSGWEALAIGNDLKAKAGTAGAVGGGSAAKSDHTGTDQGALQPYRSPFASAYLTGITDESDSAQRSGTAVTGHSDSVALYEGTQPGTDQKSPLNTPPSALNSPDQKTRDAANQTNNTDMAYDALAVSQFARLGDAVQIGKDGKVRIDEAALSQPVQIGGKDGEQYMSALTMGNKGADAAIKSNPELAKLMANGGDPTTDAKLANQFISLTGHSGGGQSSFYTALELAQRGFKNVSVVGYDMAMTPHQREVLEKLGVNVTNITGHTGSKDNYLNSTVGEGIRDAMGGDNRYYDASVDRGGSESILGAHNIVGNDRVTTMLRYSTWLDSQGKHQQWNDQNYQAFLAATKGTGDNVAGPDGSLHDSASPTSGSFVDMAHAKDPAIYMQTPQWTGQDLLNGVSSVPIVGNYLGNGLNSAMNGLLPNWRDTQLPRVDMAINPNVQAQGSVDPSQLAAQGSINLSGSTIDVLGAHGTVPDWVQASGGVNLSQGAANVNVGGQGGLGADMNLSQGNLDLNVFGHKIDVDQGLHNAWNWLTGN